MKGVNVVRLKGLRDEGCYVIGLKMKVVCEKTNLR